MKVLPNGQIELLNARKIPTKVLELSNDFFNEIERWVHSFDDANPIELTMRNVLLEYCGLTKNENILQWLNEVETKEFLVFDWCNVLTKNGWSYVYDDYRKYQNEESDKIAKEIYNNAFAYMKEKNKHER